MIADRDQNLSETGIRKVRVLLSTWGSRGDVEPLAGLAVALRELGAEALVCAPPDDEFGELLAGAGVPLVPLGPTVRSVVAGERPPTAETRARATTVAGTIRTDGATVAAKLLLGAADWQWPPMPA